MYKRQIIRDVTGKKTIVEVERSDSVKDLKDRIHTKIFVQTVTTEACV